MSSLNKVEEVYFLILKKYNYTNTTLGLKNKNS